MSCIIKKRKKSNIAGDSRVQKQVYFIHSLCMFKPNIVRLQKATNVFVVFITIICYTVLTFISMFSAFNKILFHLLFQSNR